MVPAPARSQSCVADELVGGYVQNGKEHYAAGHEKVREYSPYERLAWAILERAIDDLAAFAKAGVITRDGRCKRWPRLWRKRQGRRVYELVAIAHIKDPMAHKMTKRFFLQGAGQWLCDMLGCRLTAKEIYETTLRNHAK